MRLQHKTKLIWSALFTALGTAALVASSIAPAQAVLLSKTKATISDNAKYLKNTIINEFALNPKFVGDNLQPAREDLYPFKQTPGLFADVHFLRVKINEGSEHARKILDVYLENLDRDKTFFTRQDVRNFYETYTIGDRPLLTNQLNAAYHIYGIYLQRTMDVLRAQAQYILSLDQEPNLNTDLEIKTDKAATYRSTKESVDVIARKLALNTLITIKLDKPSYSWNEVRAYAIRTLVRTARVLNNTTDSDIFGSYMNAMTLGGGDSHSTFYPAKRENKLYSGLNPTFVGIGVQLTSERDGSFTITNLLQNGPAFKQGGLESGDIILGVSQDGKKYDNAEDFTLDTLVNKIKGKAGTKVWLKVYSKDGYLKVVSINRGEIKKEDLVSRIHRFTANGQTYGVLKFTGWYTGLAADAYREMVKNADVAGLIIDLRSNGGGLVDELQKFSQIFLDDFAPVMQITNSPKEFTGSVRTARPIVAGNNQFKFNKPIIVMIDGFSASASEIFSGAVQDYRRGIVIGNTSYGKGTVQTYFPVSEFADEGQAVITIQKFFRISGKTTQFNGVVPDIKFPYMQYIDVSERTSANPLSGTEINATKYVTYGNRYVNGSILSNLNNLANTWSQKHPEYANYVSYMDKLRAETTSKTVKVNYSYRKAFQSYQETFELDRYNKWAKSNNRPAFKNYKELQSFISLNTDLGPDPYLDLAKQMLVDYVKLWNK